MSKRILMIAGEASGDQHAASVLRQLKQDVPNLTAFGIGGPVMRAEGFDALIRSEDLSILGFWAIIKQYATIRQAFKVIQQAILKQKPDLIILVDFSGFNLRIAKFAKRHGCQILYFIGPQVWAWRQYRVKTIQKTISHMAVIFPFEKAFYEKHQVPVSYVGNPAYHDCVAYLNQRPEKTDRHDQTLGLFPGSRKSEIKTLLPLMIQTAQTLKQSNPNLKFILPLAATLSRDFVEAFIPADLDVEIRQESIYKTIDDCDAIISSSGTVTLQIALMKVPQVVIYKVSPVTAFLIKRLSNVSYVAMCNLIAGKEIARELLQSELTLDNLSQETRRLLDDQPYRADKIEKMTQLQLSFDNIDCAKGTADIAMGLMK